MASIGLYLGDEHQTYIEVQKEFMTVEQLRAEINNLYNEQISENKTNEFDLLIFRDNKEHLFWHCIFYFISCNGLPYDFLLPYENTEKLHYYRRINESTEIGFYDPEEEE